MVKKQTPRKPAWDKLPQEKRDLYLEVLWNDGFTEHAIAEFLSTTKGTIVGRRARLGLGNKDRRTIKKEVNTDRFFDLLQLHGMRRFEESSGGTVTCIGPVGPSSDEPEEAELEEPELPAPSQPKRDAPQPARLANDEQRTSSRHVLPKIAASEVTQCVHRDERQLRCAYEWTNPATHLCDAHK